MLNYSIYEDGNGGEILVQNNKIRTSKSLYPMVYLRLFGGNINGNTTREEAVGEFYKGWCGNYRDGDSDEWVNSETERILSGIALTTYNLIKIENAVKKDLSDLEQFGTIEVDVTYPNINRVQITITITETNNKEYVIILWDATKNEIIEKI